MTSLLSRALVAFVSVFLFAPIVCAVEIVWIGGPAGNWSDPANWSTGVVPSDAATNVTIDDDLLVDSVALLDQNATIQNLLVDAGDTLNFNTARALTASSVTIAGNVNFAPSSRLQVGNYLWVQQGGVLSLVDSAQVIDTTSPLYVLWNEGRIEGEGRISYTNSYGAVLNNDGAIAANVPGKQLLLGIYGTSGRGTHFNHGELIAENGGTLSIAGLGDYSRALFIPLDNTNGVIEARGDSRLSLQTIRLIGGVLSTSSAGGNSEGLITLNGVMVENVTLEGNLALNSVTFSDRVVNNTDIVVSSFFVEGYATIRGDGSMDLNGGSINVPPGQIYGGYLVGTPGFVNDVNHTIRGPGTINSPISGSAERLSFENRGVMETATGTLQFNLRLAGQLSANAQSSYNSGTIRATTGGRVEILGSSSANSEVLTNSAGATSGVIEAAPDSTVALGNMRLRGGILRAVAPGEGSMFQPGKVITNGTTTATLDNVRLEGTIGDIRSRWNLVGEIENTDTLVGQLLIVGPTTLKGGGEVQLPAPFGGIGGTTLADGFHDPLINEDNLIHGVGGIGSGLALVNRSVVQADVPKGQLSILRSLRLQPSQHFTGHINSGELKAVNGGKLLIEAPIVNYEGSNAGTIFAGDGSEVRVAEIYGGALTTEGTGTIYVDSANSSSTILNNIHNQGALVQAESLLVLGGKITNDGTITHATFGGHVVVQGAVTELAGSGVWGSSLAPLTFDIGNTNSAAGLFIHDLNHTIEGRVTINVANGAFLNRGTLLADGSTPLTVTLSPGTSMSQLGTLNVQGGHAMALEIRDTAFTNKGTIDVAGDFFLRRMNAGSLDFVNSSGGTIALRGSLVMDLFEGANLQATLWNQSGATFSGKGTVDLIDSSPQRDGTLRNSGLIRPEGEFAELGRIYLDGDFQQDSTGTLEMNVAGTEPGEFDALILSGSDAVLGGTLNVYPLATFDPPVGQMYTLIDTQGGTITGSFDNFNAPALSGRWWSLSYLTDKVVLSVEPITADFNQDGIVDPLDLANWQAASGIDGSADADGDGDSDGADFLAWQRQYGSGVMVAEGIAVPEPTAILLLVNTCVASLLRRNRRWC